MVRSDIDLIISHNLICTITKVMPLPNEVDVLISSKETSEGDGCSSLYHFTSHYTKRKQRVMSAELHIERPLTKQNIALSPIRRCVPVFAQMVER